MRAASPRAWLPPALSLMLALSLLPWAPRALAVDSSPPLPDPVMQRRYLALTHELRCMQCQNESLADSPVGLAADLRRNVRELVLAGETDEQIRDHMVARYGEFILFRPRMDWRNAWLWSAPGVLRRIGRGVAGRVVRDRRRRLELEPPEADESLDT
ncbi:MAG TPA: cytochrome c-type biogenesis protein [Steroidobacteraceae bacterium]